jgi:predicted O-linked N-acetylglucosamine transferase (SPINDLY family)
MSAALAAFAAGDRALAVRCARSVLADGRSAPAAWQFLGTLSLAENRPADAVRWLRRSLADLPSGGCFADLGLAAIEAGDLRLGVRALTSAVRHEPTHRIAHWALARALRGLASPSAAKHERTAAAVAPDLPEAWTALGAHASDGRRRLVCLRRPVALTPGAPAVHANLGGVLMQERRYAEAHRSLRHSLSLEPTAAAGHGLEADLYARRGQAEKSLPRWRRALALDPLRSESLAGAASCYLQAGDASSATPLLRRALVGDPAAVGALSNLGALLRSVERGVDGFRYLTRALAADPQNATALVNRVPIFRSNGWLRLAGRDGRRSLAADPGSAAGFGNLGGVHMIQSRLDDAARLFRRALACDPRRAEIHSNLLFTLCFDEAISPARLLDEHRAFDARHARHVRPADFRGSRDPERRLTLGFLSPDFRRHPGGHFLLPPIRHRDRAAFRVVCYHLHPTEDPTTERFRRNADDWRPVFGRSDADLAEQILDDSVDILMECAGHMAGNRLLTVARKPAPIVVSFPLYPATTGLGAVDYRIGDPYFTPPSTDAWHSERILRLPDAHVCYEPGDWAVDPTDEPPCRDRKTVTLGSFNNVAKIGSRTVRLWSQILRRVPHSVLVLKWSGLGDADPDWILDRFAAEGADRSRLKLSGSSPDPYTPYRDIDIALDPLHANGGTTTCDALWMGVPVVTWPGSTPFSRVGLCHLTNVGLPELIAATPQSYVDLVEDLASNVERLGTLRRGLRERFAASPLMDGPRYARNLEAALRRIWRQWCARQSERP